MLKRFLAFVLAFTMVFGCFGGAITVSANETEDGLVASYDFSALTAEGKIADTVGGNDATIVRGVENATAPAIVDGALELNNNDPEAEERSILGGSHANALQIPNEVFVGLGDFTIEMEVKLHSSSSSSTLICAGTDGDVNAIDTDKTNRNNPYFIVVNELWGRYGLRAAGTNYMVGIQETSIGSEYSDKVGVEDWTTVKVSHTAAGYTELFLDGVKVMDGYVDTGIPGVAAEEGTVVQIGRSFIFDPDDKGMDGAIRSLKVYNTATAQVQDDKAPVAYYELNGDFSDSSGNGYTASKTGADNITFVEDAERGIVAELNNAGGLKRDKGASGIEIPTTGLKNAESFTLIVDAYVRNNNGDALGNQVWFDLSAPHSDPNNNRHYIVGMLDYDSYAFNSELSTRFFRTDDKADTNRAYGIKEDNKNYTPTVYGEVGKWAQLAYVNNKGHVTLYVNGELYGTNNCLYSVADMMTVDGTQLTVGMPRFWPDLAMNAMIDTIAVYDYALTANQLSDLAKPNPLPLEAWYNFETVSGNTVEDATGNGNDATLINGGTIASDTQAKSNTLNLDNDSIKGGDAQGLLLPNALFTENGDITIMMDVKLGNSITWTGLLAAGSNQKNYMILVNQGTPAGNNVGLTNATKLNNATERRIYANSNTKLPLGEWSRLVFTQSATGASKLYIDGKQVASGSLDTLQALAKLSGCQVRIGSNHIWPDPGLDGRVDNIRIYSKVLTEDEMATVPFAYEKEPVGEDYFPELGANGLRADYYLFNQSDLTYGDYRGTYVEPNIESSNMETTIAAKAGAADAVGAVWTGRIAAPEDGNYTFYIYSDNGVRLYIDGEKILDWWVNEWDKEQTSKKVTLKKGEAHDFRLEWFEYSGGSHITLRWKNDETLSKSVVPASAFYLPNGFDAPVITEMDTSKAILDRGDENFGGELVLKGTNLDKAEDVELVNNAGASLDPAVKPEIVSKTADTITIKIPDVKAGTYKIKLSNDDVVTTSDVRFNIKAAPGESDRPEHPNPNWLREDWISLNGSWNFAYDAKEVGIEEEWFKDGKKDFDLKINVPYPWESELSGIQDTFYRGEVWYNRIMTIPAEWIAEGKTTHLYFGAVDAICNVYVNGEFVGSHNGGYTQFEFDITDYVKAGDNTVTLWVQDEASYGSKSYPALVGKQGHNAPCGYTHTSGIWQTVYIESRTETYFDYAHANVSVKLDEDDMNSVQFDANIISGAAQDVVIKYAFESKLWNEAKGIDEATGSSFTAQETVTLKAGANEISLKTIEVPNAKWWSDTNPNLYYGTITIETADGQVLDVVNTYFGLREVYTAYYDGRDYEYIFLNGKPIFLSGLLDQGFWEEGIYTPPSEYAAKYDILAMKNEGFNMIRKHLKIEDPLQYLWCDKLGMFVWQDMPHATAMNANNTADGSTPGRPIYEECLMSALKRDYNKPSIIAVMLFNETWGISHSGGKSKNDGMTTHQWMEYLYHMVKDYNPSLLVEDMSACSNDHIQPTDLNTFHMYPKTYSSTKSTVQSRVNGAYKGSSNNFYSGYKQEGEPLLNSEYGGVGASAGDYDVSLCFKYQTDIQRSYEKMNGYVYTEPYDIEYERNGIMSYDRRTKAFPYGEVAYGGDMSLVDLNQPNFVGVDIEPAKVVSAGGKYSANVIAMNWSGDEFENAVLKWRFDATDVYGNNITTGISGEKAIEYPAYTAETVNVSFNVPEERCVGTLTVWIEENGEKVAKNFVNVIVNAAGSSAVVDYIDEDSVTLRASSSDQELKGTTGTLTYEYSVPAGFTAESLKNIRVIAEASAVKGASINHGIDNSAYSQTTPGSERPSDMTVSINGIEIETFYLPDNPRDIRGTLTINAAHNGGSSAGNFGYLMNLNVPADKMDAVVDAIAAEGKIIVEYTVKEDAEHTNGLRIYCETTGRYAVNPTVILNPNDLYESAAPKSGNYLVSATLADGQSISLRGGVAEVKLTGTELSLFGQTATVAAGEHLVAVRVFDDHYQVYVDNELVPVIDTYDYTEYTITDVDTNGTDLVIAPELPVGTGAIDTYTITTDVVEGVTINTEATEAVEGDEITFSLTTEEGYVVQEVIVADEEGNEIEFTVENDVYSFVMPASNVVISVIASTNDQAAVQEVIDLIDEIGEVTLESEEAIKAARAAYSALTDEQKAAVTNAQDLIDAEHAWIILKADAYADAAEEAADAAQKAYEDAQAAYEQAKAEIAEDQTAAEEAKAEAEAAQAAAEAAQAEAEAARAAAEEAAKAAEDESIEAAAEALKAAQEALKATEEAQKTAEYAAKTAEALAKAQAAQAAAEQAAKDAEQAAKDAEEALKDAEQAAKDAEEALKDAEQAKEDAAQKQQAAEEAAAAAQEALRLAELANEKFLALYQLSEKARELEDLAPQKVDAINELMDELVDAIDAALTSEEVKTIMEGVDEAIEAIVNDCPASKFTDVDLDAYYHESLDYMVGMGYMNGLSATEFAPNMNTSRAMVVTILYRLAGSPAVVGLDNPFTDVAAGTYYTDAVVWAVENGITTGRTATIFDPNTNVTRQEMVTLLWRFVGKPASSKLLNAYTDANEVGEPHQASMKWAVENGIISGMTETTLAPTGTATRAQVATILARYLMKAE